MHEFYVKAGGGHFMLSQSLTNCSLCRSNDNVFSTVQTLCAFHSV